MGYYVQSKRINIKLSLEQQEKAVEIWRDIFINQPFLMPQDKYYECTWMRIHADEFQKGMQEGKYNKATDFFNELNVSYIQQKNGTLILKEMSAKWRNQSYIFLALENVLTPGSFLTLRGEDGAKFGWFFNGSAGVVEYKNQTELKQLQEKLLLKNKLDTELPINQTQSRPKI